jgi:polyhydroxybutyrate depolymerase
MKSRSEHFYRCFFLSALFSIFLNASPPAHADEQSQGKFRQALKERIIKRLEDQPAPATNATVTDKITKAGDYYFSIEHGGLARMYHVHVPPGYNASTPIAALFAFHGGGGDMEYMAKDDYYGLISKSNKEGFVVVFPNGYSKFKSGKLATWNAGACCGDARDKNIDDVGFVRTMIANIAGQMNIDRGKIFATGMSNGGMMAQRLACELPELFKAIASVAGTDNTLQCNPVRLISILNIHAKNDDHVLFNGGAGSGAFKDTTKVTNFTSIPETVSRWIKRNHCNAEPKRVLDVAGAYCDLYSACADNVEVKLCVTETGAHSWPGGKKPRGETPFKALSANDEMWNFFMNLH